MVRGGDVSLLLRRIVGRLRRRRLRVVLGLGLRRRIVRLLGLGIVGLRLLTTGVATSTSEERIEEG